MGFKRRRRTLAAAVAAATLLTAGAELDAERSLRPTSELELGGGGSDHIVEPNELHEEYDEYTHTHSEAFQRHLAQSSAEAFADVATRYRESIPLDLEIDVTDPSAPVAYMVGRAGHLENYADAFARISQGEDVNGAYFDSVLEVDEIVEGRDDHAQSVHRGRPERMYYQILEEDGVRSGANPSLRGRRDDRKLVQTDGLISSALQLDSIRFEAAKGIDGLDGHVEDESEEEIDEDALLDHGRSLQDSSASIFADSTLSGMELANSNRENRKKNKQNGRNKNKQNKKRPKLDQFTPSKGGAVRESQTFSVRALPSQNTRAPIDKVTFQLTDNEGSQSGWLDVPKVDQHFFEISIEGFDKYANTRWKYQFRARDEDGNSSSSGTIRFKVVGNAGDSGNNFASSKNSDSGNDNDEAIEKAPPSNEPMPKTKVRDSDWSYGGEIQQSVGRIMFEFDGTDQTFVCSGTVVCDGNGGRPDTRNGRSIVQTAAHCAYNDQLKKFATRALFIPEQVATRGGKSDMECSNDKYGCWHMSFAIVAKGWTEGTGFPYNVGYDYAYYVVHDDRSTHKRGYQSGLTGTLDKDIPCMSVDFSPQRRNDKFIYSLGYSADRDPDYRHCAMEAETINGIPTYTNLWLDDCAMSGGASGGPWMRDLDRSGRGTLVSVNSWGFTHREGMAGPVLSTEEGSMAECLFDQALRANDPGRQGGIVVNNC